jgi:hypothetical protein
MTRSGGQLVPGVVSVIRVVVSCPSFSWGRATALLRMTGRATCAAGSKRRARCSAGQEGSYQSFSIGGNVGPGAKENVRKAQSYRCCMVQWQSKKTKKTFSQHNLPDVTWCSGKATKTKKTTCSGKKHQLPIRKQLTLIRNTGCSNHNMLFQQITVRSIPYGRNALRCLALCWYKETGACHENKTSHGGN